jgi:hypothetical protein
LDIKLDGLTNDAPALAQPRLDNRYHEVCSMRRSLW